MTGWRKCAKSFYISRKETGFSSCQVRDIIASLSIWRWYGSFIVDICIILLIYNIRIIYMWIKMSIEHFLIYRCRTVFYIKNVSFSYIYIWKYIFCSHWAAASVCILYTNVCTYYTFQIMKFKPLNENLIWELKSRAVLWGNIDSKLFEVFDLFIWICANIVCQWNFNFLSIFSLILSYKIYKKISHLL